MTNPIDQQARELLACPFCGGEASLTISGNVRSTRKCVVKCSGCRSQRIHAALRYGDDWLRATAVAAWNRRALTPTGENAKHVEVLRRLHDDAHCSAVLERGALQAAIRALSAPDNAEGEGVACGKCGVRQPLQHSPDCGRSAPKISVSEEILMWCKDTIEALEEAGGPTNNSRAYAIRRVVAACKGVGQ